MISGQFIFPLHLQFQPFFTISAVPYNHQQSHHNQINNQVQNRGGASNQQLNANQQQNNSNFYPQMQTFGTFTPNNMFTYDSRMIQNARLAMMSQPQVGHSNDELAQPDQLISIEENGQKAQIIEYRVVLQKCHEKAQNG